MFAGFHGEQTSGDPVSVLRVGMVFESSSAGAVRAE